MVVEFLESDVNNQPFFPKKRFSKKRVSKKRFSKKRFSQKRFSQKRFSKKRFSKKRFSKKRLFQKTVFQKTFFPKTEFSKNGFSKTYFSEITVFQKRVFQNCFSWFLMVFCTSSRIWLFDRNTRQHRRIVGRVRLCRMPAQPARGHTTSWQGFLSRDGTTDNNHWNPYIRYCVQQYYNLNPPPIRYCVRLQPL